MKIDFKEDDVTMLVFAFRYALGRQTSAPSVVVGILLDNWDKFDTYDQQQIKKEIREQEEMFTNGLGMDCDKETWYRVLNR